MADDAKRSAGGGDLRGSLLGAGVLLIVALLVIVNYLGWKYYARTDWTETKIYSLSETTENVLAGLDDLGKDVRVTVFITPGSRALRAGARSCWRATRPPRPTSRCASSTRSATRPRPSG